MIFCQSVSAVLVASTLLGSGDTQTLTAIYNQIGLNLFALRGGGETKTLLSRLLDLAPSEPPSENCHYVLFFKYLC